MDIYLGDDTTCGAEETNLSQPSLPPGTETIPMLELDYTESENGLCAHCEYVRRCERLRAFMGQSIECPIQEAMEPISNDVKERLCNRCRRVQWNKAAGVMLPEPAWAKFLFTVNETHEELLVSNCPVCQYIGRMRDPHWTSERGFLNMKCICSILSGYDISRHHTNGFDHSPLFQLESFNKDDKDWKTEGIFGVLHPWSEHDQLAPRRIDSESINYSIIREWIRTCEELHEDTCTSRNMQNVPGFKVIDCTTKQIVKMVQKNCQYLALSYVWGTGYSSIDTDGTYPKTIQDSIDVCSALGYQYLWVDYYCIDQQNVAEKQIQIQMMDCIYSQAQLTIIAAAGKDPTHGLPGVSTTARLPQLRLRLGDVELVQIFQSDQEVFDSKWATRGWTFQEGYLSKKRLIFTQSEVMYLCDQMCCQESVRRDTHTQHSDVPYGLSCEVLEGIFPMASEKKRGELKTNWLLAEYDTRELTNSGDILDACQGILNGLDIPHLWGIPIRKTSWSNENTPRGETSTLALWWETDRRGRRRASFPSWSWTGWDGVKSFYASEKHYAYVCSVSFMARNGQWEALEKLPSTSAIESEASATQSLRITGPTCAIKPHIVNQAWVKLHMPGYQTSHEGPFAVFPYSETVDIFAIVRLDEEGVGLDVSPDALGLTIHKHKEQKFRHTMLILEPHEDRYKRIGIIECLHVGVFKDRKDWTESRKFLQRQDCPFWMKTVSMRTVCVE